MLKEMVERDIILTYLLQRSKITKAQLDTIIINSHSINLKEKILLRDEKKVSKGSFLRTLSQGEANVESSFYVIILMQYLGLFDDSFDNLLKIANLLKDVKLKNVDRTEMESIILLIDSSIKKITKIIK